MVSVEILHQGRSYRLQALVDSGHRLREPLTGRPVVVGSRGSVEEKAFWPIRYESVGGEGLLYGFWPQKLWIDQQLYKEKEVLVAIADEWQKTQYTALVPSYLLLE